MKYAYQLHDYESEEIVGAVLLNTQPTPDAIDEIFEGWEVYNKLEETECDPKDVDEFVDWFNEGYVTQLENLYIDFIQH